MRGFTGVNFDPRLAWRCEFVGRRAGSATKLANRAAASSLLIGGEGGQTSFAPCHNRD